MRKLELAQSIYKKSYITGNFLLRSGQRSKEYFDKYLFESDPRLLKTIARLLYKKLPQSTQILAGLETGGIPIATALALETGLPVVFVRKKAKEYGTCKIAEGVNVKNKNLCIIEDVITTGGQVILSAEDLRKLDAKVKNVLCVILRDEKATELLKNKKLSLNSLFTMDELKKLG